MTDLYRAHHCRSIPCAVRFADRHSNPTRPGYGAHYSQCDGVQLYISDRAWRLDRRRLVTLLIKGKGTEIELQRGVEEAALEV